jgi:hypothetical protein
VEVQEADHLHTKTNTLETERRVIHLQGQEVVAEITDRREEAPQAAAGAPAAERVMEEAAADTTLREEIRLKTDDYLKDIKQIK